MLHEHPDKPVAAHRVNYPRTLLAIGILISAVHVAYTAPAAAIDPDRRDSFESFAVSLAVIWALTAILTLIIYFVYPVKIYSSGPRGYDGFGVFKFVEWGDRNGFRTIDFRDGRGFLSGDQREVFGCHSFMNNRRCLRSRYFNSFRKTTRSERT